MKRDGRCDCFSSAFAFPLSFSLLFFFFHSRSHLSQHLDADCEVVESLGHDRGFDSKGSFEEINRLFFRDFGADFLSSFVSTKGGKDFFSLFFFFAFLLLLLLRPHLGQREESVWSWCKERERESCCFSCDLFPLFLSRARENRSARLFHARERGAQQNSRRSDPVKERHRSFALAARGKKTQPNHVRPPFA